MTRSLTELAKVLAAAVTELDAWEVELATLQHRALAAFAQADLYTLRRSATFVKVAANLERRSFDEVKADQRMRAQAAALQAETGEMMSTSVTRVPGNIRSHTRARIGR